MQEVSSLKQNKGAGGKAGQIISKLKDKPFLMSLSFNDDSSFVKSNPESKKSRKKAPVVSIF